MQKLLKTFRLVDYLVAAGTVGYGIYALNALVVAFGLCGFGLAYLNLADRISKKLTSTLKRKAPSIVAEHLDPEDVRLPATAAASKPNSYGSNLLSTGPLTATNSAHNVLKAEGAFNHSSGVGPWV